MAPFAQDARRRRLVRNSSGWVRRLLTLSLVAASATALAPLGSAHASTASAVGLAASSRGGGWVAFNDGEVRPFGGEQSLGSMAGHPLNRPVVGIASTPSGAGYWLVASDGGIFSFGDARFYGSTGNLRLNRPVVSMAVTFDGGGYWLVAADGGVFSFGDAHFYGSTGNLRLNKPVIGASSTSDGGGYFLVGSDGGVFTFGDARFSGSMGAHPGAYTAVASSAAGYLLMGSDGTLISYGGAPLAGTQLGPTMVGLSMVPGATGYWEADSAGNTFAFGNDTPLSAVPPSGGTGDAPYAQSSFWNYAPPANLGAPPDSQALVDAFVSQYTHDTGRVGVNLYQYTVPIYQVPSGQAMVPVTQQGWLYNSEVQAQIAAVPIPPNAQPSPGSDADLVIWQPSSDTEWELWGALETNGQWTARWGGQLDTMSSSSGIFPNPFGVAASGLPLLGGTIRVSELQAGSINHVLAVALPHTVGQVWPASRHDGNSTSPDAIAEGTRFRLNPYLDLASLQMSPFARMVAQALQTYGMVVTDTSGTPTLYAQSQWQFMPSATSVNPYSQWLDVGATWDALDGIPWNQLEAVDPSVAQGL